MEYAAYARKPLENSRCKQIILSQIASELQSVTDPNPILKSVFGFYNAQCSCVFCCFMANSCGSQSFGADFTACDFLASLFLHVSRIFCAILWFCTPFVQMNEQLPLSFAEEFQKSSEISWTKRFAKMLKIARLTQGQWLDCFDSVRVMMSKCRKYILYSITHERQKKALRSRFSMRNFCVFLVQLRSKTW